MIEKCIFEVYNRDKKVFLPEFGAIIYSDFNDSVDFNDLLTFDDGKVVEEIQNQLSLSEEEARKALEEHIQQIKDTLGKGKLHYFSGIGYLSKDDQGNYSIEKSKPVTETSPRKKATAKKSSSTTTKSKTSATTEKKASSTRKKSTTSKKKEEEPKVEEPIVVPPVEELPEPENNLKEEVTIPEPEEKTPEPFETYNSTDETEYEVEEDKAFASFASDDSLYNEYDEKHEEEKSSSAKNIIWIVIVVILLSVGSFYLYKTFFADPISDNPQMSASIEDDDIAKDPISNTIPSQTKEEITSEVEGNSESAPEDTKTEASTPSSNVDPTDPDEQKTFSLILGSFKEESNADKYLQRLNSRGLVVDKFKGMNNFYFVGIEKIEGKSNAVRQLEELKKKEPSAWIYNVERLL